MRIRSSFIGAPFRCPDPSICNSFAFKCAADSRSMVLFETNCSTSIDFDSRCEGLDLLVKAAVLVAGELFFESPKIDRERIERTRNRAHKFRNSSVCEIGSKESKAGEEEEEHEGGIEKDRAMDVISKPKRRQRVMALPSKYNDSILQPWKRRTRPKRSVGITRLPC